MKRQEEHTEAVVSQTSSSYQVVLEVRDMVRQLVQAVVDFRVMLSHQTITRPLDPTRNLPLVVEDPWAL